MPQSRDELLRKKREYANRVYKERGDVIRARGRHYRRKFKERDPVAFAERVRAYNLKYQAKNPARRSESTRAYYWRNRDACNRRAVDCHRRRKQADPLFALSVIIRNRFVALLQRAKCAPTTEETREIHRWFEWLRERGHADWRAKGIEIDHVIPVSRFNVAAPGAGKAINHWRNLFPLSREENRNKRARVMPDYIRRVWGLAEEFMRHERQTRVA